MIYLLFEYSQGRRIPFETGIDHPTCADIAAVCSNLDLPHKIEADKCYSRDFQQKGRVRIQIKQANGNSCNAAILRPKQLWRVLAAQIPLLPQREANRLAEIAYQQSLLVTESMFMSKEEKKELEREQQQGQQKQLTKAPQGNKKKARKQK
jgi:signal recognition particle subunit SEC65